MTHYLDSDDRKHFDAVLQLLKPLLTDSVPNVRLSCLSALGALADKLPPLDPYQSTVASCINYFAQRDTDRDVAERANATLRRMYDRAKQEKEHPKES